MIYVSDLNERMKLLERKLDFFITAFNLSDGDRIADLNERVREAMQHIANELEVSLYSLYDDKERKR